MSKEVPFDYPSACREFCPVQRDFASQQEMASLAITSIRSLSEQYVANKWHAAYLLTHGNHEQTADLFNSEQFQADSEADEIARIETYLDSLSADEIEEFFTASQDAASKAVAYLNRTALEATEAHAVDLEASCRFGPQLARIAINSNHTTDPAQDSEAVYVACLEKNSLSSAAVSPRDEYELSKSIANDRNLNLMTDILQSHPDALEVLHTYSDIRSLDTE